MNSCLTIKSCYHALDLHKQGSITTEKLSEILGFDFETGKAFDIYYAHFWSVPNSSCIDSIGGFLMDLYKDKLISLEVLLRKLFDTTEELEKKDPDE